MTSAPVAVAVVSSRIEAELIVGLLRSHGLRAAAVSDDAGGQEPQWQLNAVQVLVPHADEHAAREILATVADRVGPTGPAGTGRFRPSAGRPAAQGGHQVATLPGRKAASPSPRARSLSDEDSGKQAQRRL